MTLNGMMVFKDLLCSFLTGFYETFSLVGSGELERLTGLAPKFHRWCSQVTKEVGAEQRVCSRIKMKKGS